MPLLKWLLVLLVLVVLKELLPMMLQLKPMQREMKRRLLPQELRPSLQRQGRPPSLARDLDCPRTESPEDEQ